MAYLKEHADLTDWSNSLRVGTLYLLYLPSMAQMPKVLP